MRNGDAGGRPSHADCCVEGMKGERKELGSADGEPLLSCSWCRAVNGIFTRLFPGKEVQVSGDMDQLVHASTIEDGSLFSAL